MTATRYDTVIFDQVEGLATHLEITSGDKKSIHAGVACAAQYLSDVI